MDSGEQGFMMDLVNCIEMINCIMKENFKMGK